MARSSAFVSRWVSRIATSSSASSPCGLLLLLVHRNSVCCGFGGLGGGSCAPPPILLAFMTCNSSSFPTRNTPWRLGPLPQQHRCIHAPHSRLRLPFQHRPAAGQERVDHLEVLSLRLRLRRVHWPVVDEGGRVFESTAPRPGLLCALVTLTQVPLSLPRPPPPPAKAAQLEGACGALQRLHCVARRLLLSLTAK